MPDTSTKPTCRVLRPGADAYAGKQGFTYAAGISAETTGARGICMHLLTIQPGDRAKAHLHENHETAIYALRGQVRDVVRRPARASCRRARGRDGLHPGRRAAPAGQPLRASPAPW